MAHRVAPACVLLAACNASDDSVMTSAAREQVVLQIVGGVPSTDGQDATVMLIHLDEKRGHGICTGVMIAPRLVLTARHCVSRTDRTVGCDSDGTPFEASGIYEDFDAKDLYVFTGKDRAAFTNISPSNVDPARWNPAARGTTIFHDGSGTLCNHDIALLALDTALTTPLASLRLSGEPTVGEATVSVGWGLTTSGEPTTRLQRRDIVVRRLGPSDSYPVLSKNEFLTGEGICLGDSGGPIFSQQTNAVIGVVSRGGNGSDFDVQNPQTNCIDADNFNTKLSPFRELIDRGFAAVGSRPILESAPDDDGCSVAAVGGTSRSGIRGLAVLLSLLAVVRRRNGKRVRAEAEARVRARSSAGIAAPEM